MTLFLQRHATGTAGLARGQYLLGGGSWSEDPYRILSMDGLTAWGNISTSGVSTASVRASSIVGGNLFICEFVGSSFFLRVYPITQGGVGVSLASRNLGFTVPDNGMRVSPGGGAVAVGTTTWLFDGSSLTEEPWPVSVTSGAAFFNRAGDVIFLVKLNTPRQVHAYEWDDATGFGDAIDDVALSDPFLLPWLVFDFLDDAVVAMEGSSRRFAVRFDSAGGFGAPYALPSFLSAATVFTPRFSPSGNFVAVLTAEDPRLSVFEWDSAAGFGAMVMPDIRPTISSSDTLIAWASDESAVFVSRSRITSTTPIFTMAWPRSAAGFGSPVAVGAPTRARGSFEYGSLT